MCTKKITSPTHLNLIVIEGNLLNGFRFLSSESKDVEIRELLTPIVGHPDLLPIRNRNIFLHMIFVFFMGEIEGMKQRKVTTKKDLELGRRIILKWVLEK
jgi:hypothetical protein